MAALLTYTLTHQCGPSRPFCRQCANSFTVSNCRPTRCKTEPPSQICLRPRLPGFIKGDCGQFDDCGETMPEQWRATLEWPDTDGPGPKTAGSLTVIGTTRVRENGQLPFVCGPAACGFSVSFHSQEYPTILGNPSNEFTLCAMIGPAGVIAKVSWIIDPFTIRQHDFKSPAGTEWWRLKDPDSGLGELCTDYNQIAPCPMIGGNEGGDLALGIMLTLYPNVSE